LLFSNKEPEQIGVVLLGRFRRLYAFEPEHYAVTRIVVCPANQSPKTRHHLAPPLYDLRATDVDSPRWVDTRYSEKCRLMVASLCPRVNLANVGYLGIKFDSCLTANGQ
tara:strand:+ start:129 stop:455 length:327 start_codon:yes stop_codon:yes gene_type:complete